MRSPIAKEVEILSILIKKAGLDIDPVKLQVETMDDGGMGSLKIGANYSGRSYGSCASEYQFTDSDNIAVSATLNLDKEGNLYELDIFKADFSETLVLNGNS